MLKVNDLRVMFPAGTTTPWACLNAAQHLIIVDRILFYWAINDLPRE